MHRDEVTRGQRVLAAFHDDVGEKLVQRLGFGVVRIGGGFAGEDAAQHPPRSVHTDDAGDDLASALDHDRQCQFGAEHAVGLLGVFVGLNQVGAHVIPQSHGLRRGEGFDLHAGGSVGDGGAEHLLGGAVGLHAQFDALEERQIVGAHVEVFVIVGHVLVVDVPRTVLIATAVVLIRRFRKDGFLNSTGGRLGGFGDGLIGLVVLFGGGFSGFLALTLLLAESKQSHDVPHFITVATVTSLAPMLNTGWESECVLLLPGIGRMTAAKTHTS